MPSLWILGNRLQVWQPLSMPIFPASYIRASLFFFQQIKRKQRFSIGAKLVLRFGICAPGRAQTLGGESPLWAR